MYYLWNPLLLLLLGRSGREEGGGRERERDRERKRERNDKNNLLRKRPGSKGKDLFCVYVKRFLEW